jgi:prevent-host-death family protein
MEAAMEVGAFEAKNTLGSLLDRVERGEEIVITRRGRPVARLVPETGEEERRARAREAAAAIRELARTVKLGRFDWDEWKAFRDEGRPRAS